MAVEGGEPELSPNPAGNSAQDDDEGEYESDSEAVVPLALRRREASDDEDGAEEEGNRRRDRRIAIDSERDSDAEGRPAAYEEEEEVELEGEGEEGEEFEEEEDIGEGDDVGGVAQEVTLVISRSGEVSGDGENEASPAERDLRGKNRAAGAAEDKKENEPFAVPTAGAFYMHDDRFRDSGGARHRRTAGGRKLWESKDDRAWVHDRFEEMNMKEEQYNEKTRGSRGHFRGRGRTRGREGGFARGNGPRYFDENKINRTLIQPQQTVKGRGPRKYDSVKNKVDTLTPRDKQLVRSNDTNASTGRGRSSSDTSTLQPEMPGRKHVFASSLNSASPPFYPSGSSGQDTSSTQKRDIRAGNAGRSPTNSANSVDEKSMASNTNISMRGKTVVDSIGQDRIKVNQSMRPVIEKTLPNVQMHASGSSPSVSGAQSSQTKVQGKGLVVPGRMSYPVAPSAGPMARVSSQAPVPAQQRAVQGQSTVRSSIQQLSQRPGGGPQEPSSSQVSSVASLHEVDEMESPQGSSKSKLPFSGMGKVAPQGNGKASFLYGGAQVIGSTNSVAGGHGDQNFPPTPALLPVMQFGGQHHGGLGVPAVGMAFPGYVGQPQAGFGNSEMTWLPVLSGAAGALGASYCSPYFAFDSGYYSRSSGQTSSASSSRDSSSSKSANTLKAPQKPADVVNDEFGQRQNKPRRYSEMNFGQ